MKPCLINLAVLIFCLSCGTNNKPVSDAQKEKIRGEIKEVVNTFIKGIEEANADMVMESFLDSPDFTDITNGMVFSYKELVDMKPNFDAILNQKCTMVDEKYTFLDKSTVLYTAENKWSTNYKDGRSSITDPQAFLFVFKKIDNRWKIIYLVDSNVEKDVPGESTQGLNQVELMSQFVGIWKGEMGKDTIFIMEGKTFGKGLDFYWKTYTKGNTLSEGKSIMGYDIMNNRIIEPQIWNNNPNIILWSGLFTSSNIYEAILWKDLQNPGKATVKWKYEFKSSDVLVCTYTSNKKEIVTILNRE